MRLTDNQYYIINTLIVLIFLISMLLMYNPKPKLLILHSYDTDYNWVLQINEGIQRITKLHNIRIRYHYMNLKNKFTEQDKKESREMALNLIESYNPNVMIIADDAAQELIGSKFVNRDDVSIVFCAVNGEVDKYGYDKAYNVTGIYERKPLKAIKETLLFLAKNKYMDYYQNSKIARVLWLVDNSDSVTQEIRYFSGFDWFPLHWLPPSRANNLWEWQENLFQANDIADLVVVSDYREFKNPDGSKEDVKPDAIMRWTEKNSTNPVLGMSLINVCDGGSLSVFNSGYEQGEVAAQMAMEIIKGKKPKDIEKIASTQFITAVRDTEISRKHYPNLPEIYRAFSKAVGNGR